MHMYPVRFIRLFFACCSFVSYTDRVTASISCPSEVLFPSNRPLLAAVEGFLPITPHVSASSSATSCLKGIPRILYGPKHDLTGTITVDLTQWKWPASFAVEFILL